jgi:hypothetical protein
LLPHLKGLFDLSIRARWFVRRCAVRRECAHGLVFEDAILGSVTDETAVIHRSRVLPQVLMMARRERVRSRRWIGRWIGRQQRQASGSVSCISKMT